MTARLGGSGCRISTRRAGAQVVLVVEGRVDLPAAVRVAAAARAEGAGVRVRLDLRNASLEDVALAALARAAADGRRVEVVGLSLHHERLLRYLREDGTAPQAEGTSA